MEAQRWQQLHLPHGQQPPQQQQKQEQHLSAPPNQVTGVTEQTFAPIPG